MKIYVINGPSLNMLGIREPEKYGRISYGELCDTVEGFCRERGCECVIFQSNHEGALIDKIQEAYTDGADGIVINAGAYTHTSIALLDALLAVSIPAVEVHITDVSAREDFRRVSYISRYCEKVITGRGIAGYTDAIRYLLEERK